MQQAKSLQAIDSRQGKVPVRAEISAHSRRDRGAMLLAVLFLMAIMVITAMAVAPALVQQIKRDREEEMIHRGTEYERAIKKYYKKFGRYPANLEQLENTNQIRFLRRRFKDPLAKDGQWKLLHYGDIQSLVGAGGLGVQGLQPGVQGGLQGPNSQNPSTTGTTGSDLGASTAPTGAQLTAQQQSGFLTAAQPGGVQPGGLQPGGGASAFAAGGSGGAAGQSGFSLGPSQGQAGGVGGSQPGSTTGQTGSNNSIFGNSGVGGQTFGGGAIVGVASKSKDPTIRVYNKKKNYDEWVFIYSPMLDRQNMLLRGPYNGQSMVGGQFGTPTGQLNQTNQTGIGQQPGGLGQQQPGGFGQQNQPITPGTQFPPDQAQPQPQP
jgi:type II secretory pathway pseudopilin PulG